MLSVSSLLHKIPFLRLFIFFILGIIASNYGMNAKFIPIILISAVMFLFLHLLILKQKEESQYSHRWFFGASIFSFMFAFGMIMSHFTKSYDNDFDAAYYYGRVLTLPKQCSEKTVKCDVLLSEIKDEGSKKENQSFKAVVYLPCESSSKSLTVGDSMIISAQPLSKLLRNPELELTDNSNILFVEEGAWSLLSHSSQFNASDVRQSLLNLLKKKDVTMMN